MIGAVFSKVMWVGKATTFCVGLAVVPAVMFGIGTTALTAVPGDPFRLGRINTVDRLTTLAGSVGGPLLKVDNDGSDSALALETEAGNPPLRVNAGAGKVTNLDADALDGKDSGAFLAADGKASDSAHADWADTAASADSAATAGDANTLDGIDSTQFMRAISYSKFAPTADSDSVSPKTVVVECPGGDRALSGHAEIVAPTNQQIPVALQSVGTSGLSSWRAEAAEMVPYDGSWSISITHLTH